MAGQGSPRASRCAGGLWLPALVAFALAALPPCHSAAADIDARIRLAWGGGEARSWQGTLHLSEGQVTEVAPLGWEADSPGSLQRTSATVVRIVPRSPRSYDGCDLRVEAPENAKLLVQLWSDGEPAGAPVEVPLAKVIRGFTQFDLDDRGNRLFAQRSPGDTLRVAFARDALLFVPGERFDLEVQPNVPDLTPGTAYLLAASLETARTDEQLWNKDFEVRTDSSGQGAAVPLAIPLPETEGAYDVKLHLYPKRLTTSLVRGKPLATRRVQLIVVAPVKLLDRQPAAWQSVLEFDPASPKWYERLVPRLPAWTRLPSLPQPVESGPAKTRSHLGRTWVELAPQAWQAYPLSVVTPGTPHILEVEYPSDVEQTLGISLIEPNAAGQVGPIGLDSGVDVPAPQSGHAPQLRRHRLVCWPQTRTPYVLVVNRRRDRPALAGRIQLLAGPRELPAASIPQPRFPARTLAAYYDKPQFAENFSATEAVDPISRRHLDDWVTFHEAGRRLVETLQAGGFNSLVLTVACDGGAIYPSRLLEPTPKYDTGVFFESGQDAVRKDVLELLMRLCDRSGIQLIPAVQFAGPLPQLEALRLLGGPESVGLEPIDPRGQTWLARRGTEGGAGVYYNALDPRVQETMRAVVGEISERYGHHACFGGVAVQLGSESYSLLPDEMCSLDDATFARFLAETQTEMPPAADLPPLVARARFVRGPGEAAWLKWRTQTLTRLYCQMRDDVAAAHRHARLYLTTANLLSGRQLQLKLRPTLPPRAEPGQFLPLLGLDVPGLLAEGIVVPRPQRIVSACEPDARLLADHNNQWSALDELFRRDKRGTALMSIEPAPVRLPNFDAVSPFGADKTRTLLLPTIVPDGPNQRERFVRSLAALDAPLLMDGGWLLPLGQMAPLAPLAKVFRRLPAEPFVTARPANPADRPAELVVRTLAKDGQTYLYVLNTSPWAITGQIELTATAPLKLTPYADERKADFRGQDGRYVWTVALEPFDLAGGELNSAAVNVAGWKVVRPEGIAESLAAELRGVTRRANALRDPPLLGVLANPSFESPAEAGDIPGWILARGPTMRVEIDRSQGDQSPGSLHLVNQSPLGQPPVWIRSLPFAPPPTGRIGLSATIRVADPARQPQLRLAIEAKQGSQVYYVFANFGQGEGDRPAEKLSQQWGRYSVLVNDLPLAGLSEMRVGFDLMSAGEVWIDDVRVHDLYFDDSERRHLLQSNSLVNFTLEAGDLLETHRYLQGYWPSFLRHHVVIPEAHAPPGEAPAASAPIALRPLLPRPPVPAATAPPRAAQKSWWDWMPWR